MVRRLLAVSILLGLLVVSGCWDLQEINASVITSGVGIDLAPGNRIAFTTQVIQPATPSESGSMQSEPSTISTVDYSVSMAARRVMLSLSRVPEWAHLKTFLLGERLSRQDLSLCIDFMTRNRNIRPDTNLLVCVDNTPEEVLKSQLLQGTILGSGLKDMLSTSERFLGFYVPVTVEKFTYSLSTPGIEPAVPQIRLKTNNNDSVSSSDSKPQPVLCGTAVFKRNKMVGSLNEYESRGYRWLVSDSKQGGFFTVKLPTGNQDIVGLEILNFSNQVKPQITGNNIKMNIEITANLGFYEQDGPGDLLNPVVIRKVEQSADQEIRRQVLACISKSQTLQSDILGWGQEIGINEPEEWKRLRPQWDSRYPSVTSNVQVKAQITRSYLGSKSFKFQ